MQSQSFSCFEMIDILGRYVSNNLALIRFNWQPFLSFFVVIFSILVLKEKLKIGGAPLFSAWLAALLAWVN